MKNLYVIWACAMLLTFVKCMEREWDSPFDPATPREAWSPSGLQAARQGNAIVLTWQQSNKKISGFVISRNENDGALQEVARPGKDVNTWSDTQITGGKKYGYQILAYAGDNLSNASSTQITLSTTASITTSAATATSCNSASAGGNITSDGGSPVTAKGVCWNTSTGPTVNNSKTADGTGTGTFSSSLTGLNGNTTYYARAYATNGEGTVYGNEVNFTTPACASVPTVTTANVTNPTQTTATGGGNVTADGGATVTAKGVCWSTTQNPTINNPKTVDGDGLGTFTSSLAGLTAGTTYYVRAYATNAAGTSYGSQVSFTTLPTAALATVTTQVPSGVTCNSANLGGSVTSDGGATVTERGVVYGITRSPTISDSKAVISSGTGTFSQVVTGLSQSTTYYVRAFAINSAGVAYGPEESLTTPACPVGPVLSTTLATSVTCSTASSGGSITSDGGSPITARGVCWGTSPNPTTSGNKTSNGTGAGTFTSTLTGLTAGNTYYYRAYATNSITTSYGQEGYFFSTPVLATVQASSPSDVTCNSAMLSGRLNNNGGIAPTEVGIVYALTQNPTTANTKIVMNLSGTSWSQLVSGFNASTTYYVRAYAINCAGTSYSNQVTLTTPACQGLPTLSTTSASGVTCTGFTSGGNITSDGGSAIIARGVCWGTSPNPTTSGNKTTNGSGSGIFTSSITGLAVNTVYYYRAYATNNNYTAYGEEYLIRTPYLATVTTATPSGVTCNSATLGGNVTSDGGATVTERGIVYATTQNPTTANSKVVIGSGEGSYSQSVAGLAASTTYYVRAYAINCAGTIYGSQVSVTTPACTGPPTVTTTTATGLTCTGFTSGGNVTSDGGSTVTARGVCWGTTANPTIAGNKTSNGTGTGIFTSSVTGLAVNTVYYYRAYATNSVSTVYGQEYTVKTPYLPTVSTASPLGVTCNSATLGGNVTTDGGAAVTERGVVYATTQYPTTANSKVIIGSGLGSFSQSVTGLAGSTTYYVRAYAINCAGTIYGSQTSFTTQASTLATVTTSTPASILDVSAVLGGNVTSQGGSTVTERGVVYGLTLNPTVNNVKVPMGSGTGVYSNTVTGLSPDVTYHARAYAINCGGVSYGADVVFTTIVGNFYITNARLSTTNFLPGQTISITFTHNLSVSTKTVYSPYVGIYLSEFVSYTDKNLILSRLIYQGGSYGSSTDVMMNWTVPVLPAGTYYFILVPDYKNTYNETDETDKEVFKVTSGL